MKNVKTTFLALIGLAVGVLFAPGLGLYTWMATATPLHPNVQDVPSVSHAAPLREWAGAVEQARQLARTSLVEQNLPGLSVAVGAGGDIVWAEGFGWADLEKRVPVAPHMRFRIGHASKALTSAAVGLAVLPVPRPTGPFTGDASLLVGAYKGLGRGRDMVIEVTQTPKGIAFAFDGAAAGPLPWVEGWTFRRDSSLLTFRRSTTSGPATELRFDTGGDHFILKRQ